MTTQMPVQQVALHPEGAAAGRGPGREIGGYLWGLWEKWQKQRKVGGWELSQSARLYKELM